MTQIADSGPNADYPADLPPEAASLWQDIEAGLTTWVLDLPDHAEGTSEVDRLTFEVVGPGSGGGAPSVTLTSLPGGHRVDAVVSGDAGLTVAHRMAAWASADLRSHGWTGNDDTDTDWRGQRMATAGHTLAREVVVAMQGVGMSHPDLYTVSASGPSAHTVDELIPLAASEGIRREASADADPAPASMVVLRPHDQKQLAALVLEVMGDIIAGEPVVDGDGDVVVDHLGHTVFIRVESDAPCVSVTARVVHGVYSRGQAATEIAVLNRTSGWSTFLLSGRDIYLRATLPAAPFAPAHLVTVLDSFCLTLAQARDDLAARVRGEVG